LNAASFDASESADLSTLFDVGGIVGGIIAGVLSDVTGMSAVTCAVMLVVAIPMVKQNVITFLENYKTFSLLF
jgi:OPA family glycerol-3-phosphate transporter-like MFS transporter 1/2